MEANAANGGLDVVADDDRTRMGRLTDRVRQGTTFVRIIVAFVMVGAALVLLFSQGLTVTTAVFLLLAGAACVAPDWERTFELRDWLLQTNNYVVALLLAVAALAISAICLIGLLLHTSAFEEPNLELWAVLVFIGAAGYRFADHGNAVFQGFRYLVIGWAALWLLFTIVTPGFDLLSLVLGVATSAGTAGIAIAVLIVGTLILLSTIVLDRVFGSLREAARSWSSWDWAVFWLILLLPGAELVGQFANFYLEGWGEGEYCTTGYWESVKQGACDPDGWDGFVQIVRMLGLTAMIGIMLIRHEDARQEALEPEPDQPAPAEPPPPNETE